MTRQHPIRPLSFWVLFAAFMGMTVLAWSARSQCDSIDFNQDGLFPDTQDVDDFRTVLAGGESSTGAHADIDFNNDGVYPDPEDFAALVRVFSGGPCVIVSESSGPAWQDYNGGPSARRVHVSSSTGSDANDGSIEHPKRTIPQGFALLLHGTGDGLFLKRGDTFPEYIGMPDGSWNKSGMHADRPLWVGAYGDGPRPVVHGLGAANSAVLRFQSGGGVSWVAVDSIDFQSVTGSPRNGISYWSNGEGLLIQNCRVQGFEGGISLESNGATLGTGLTGVVIRGCAIIDQTPRGSHSQGLYVDRASGICEWSLIDRNGRSLNGDGTIFNHGSYVTSPTTGFAFEHCIVSRNSATGLQLRAQDTNARWCLSMDNPLGITTGHADVEGKKEAGHDGAYGTADDIVVWTNQWPRWGWRGEVVHCLIVGGGDIAPTKIGTTGWNPRGMPIGLGFVAGGRFTDNVIMQVTGGDPWAWCMGGLTTTWTVERNIVYAPQGRLFQDDHRQARPSFGAGNVFHDGGPMPSGADFDTYLASIGYPSRNDYIVAARTAWSRESWDSRFSPDAAYAFVKSRLTTGSN